MAQAYEHDFALERRLRKLNPPLHRRFTDAVFSLQHILSNYKLLFPQYTDHSELHSLNVIDFCNRLIGAQIERMNADEIYVLLMGCYFHDTGMGITEKDFQQFSRDIDFGDYFETHSRENLQQIIRDFHNEFSGRFIRKYADFFEIPSQEHLWAIIEVSRGHRKTSLLNEAEFPLSMPVAGGNKICLPYLSALIRLADELDVSAARNSALLYDIHAITAESSILEFNKHNSIREMLMLPDRFLLKVSTQEPELLEKIRARVGKMQHTLDDCRLAVMTRTPYIITQEQIEIQDVGQE